MIQTPSQALQLAAWFLSIVEFVLMLYVLLLNPRHVANRAVALLFLVIVLSTLSVGFVLDPTPVYRIGLPLYVATTTTVVAGLMIVTVVLIRPEWLPGGWPAGVRRVWLPVYGLLVYGLSTLPVVLTLIDVIFGTRLWYTPPAGYAGGYVTIGEAAAGTISGFLRAPMTYLMGSVPIVLLIYVLARERKAPAGTRRLAWLLLAGQLVALVLMSTIRGPEISPLVVLIVGFLYTAVFSYAAFQQMISEGRAQAGRVQTRLISLLLVVVLPLFGGLVGVVLSRADSALEVTSDEQLATANRSVAASTETWLDLNVAALNELVILPGIADMDAAQQKPILEAMAAAYPQMYLVSTTDRQGINVARNDAEEPKDYGDRLWYQEAIGGAPLTFQLLIGRTSGTPALVVSAPIRQGAESTRQGEIVGVGMFASELTDVAQQVQLSTVGEAGFSYVVDADNRVVAHPQTMPAGLGDRSSSVPLEPLGDLSEYPPVKALRSGTRGRFQFTDKAGQLWQAYVDEMEYGWGVVVQQPDDDYSLGLRRLQRIALSYGAAGLFLLFGLTVLTVRQALRPVGALTETATAVADGDLDRVALVESGDEFGVLARTFNTMTRQLRELIAGLEQQVAERTRELEQRSSYLQATAEVGSASASLLDREELIRQVVELIRERFDLYYVGLFLADETGEWAVLEAGTGGVGRTMLARGHRIRVGEGMVGWSVAHGDWRIAAEAGADAVRLATPELPLTRSEAALPLRSRGRTLGALTVQDTEPDAFDPDTMAVLQTMADQVAVALDNAALFAESQESLSALRRAYGEASRQSWTEMVRVRPDWGYRYAHGQVSPIEGEPWPEMVQAASQGSEPGTLIGGGKAEDTPADGEITPGAGGEAPLGEVEAPQDGDRSLAIPIRVRDQQIGVLGFRKQAGEGAWTREETELLETLAGQLEVALESARLYQDTQRAASRDRLLTEVVGRVRETLDVEAVLRTLAHEVRQALELPEVVVRLRPQGPIGDDGPLAESPIDDEG